MEIRVRCDEKWVGSVARRPKVELDTIVPIQRDGKTDQLTMKHVQLTETDLDCMTEENQECR